MKKKKFIAPKTVLNEVGGAVEEELHFKTQWDAIVWMKEQLWKRGLEINPITKDSNDKVWFRHSERNKFNTKYYTTKDATNG